MVAAEVTRQISRLKCAAIRLVTSAATRLLDSLFSFCGLLQLFDVEFDHFEHGMHDSL
jgi:hypothetical protein